MGDVTQILGRIVAGDKAASGELLPLVYEELRKLASHKLNGERPGQTLQATALVHEAYLRLVGAEDEKRWDSKGHFFAAAAEAMRRILVDNARRKQRLRHGGGLERVGVELAELPTRMRSEELIALDEALGHLRARDPLKAQLVDLRFFAGLTMEQAAEALGISRATAHRHWTVARAWLHQQVIGGRGERSGQESSQGGETDGGSTAH